MKFSFKIVMGTMLIVIVMFSLSGILLIHENFKNAFELQMKTNTVQHDLEKYSLESMLNESIANGQAPDEAKLKEYLYSQSGYIGNMRRLAVILDQELLWSSIPFTIDETTMKSGDIVSYDAQKYVIIATDTSINEHQLQIISSYDLSQLYEVRNRNLACFYMIEAGLFIICATLITLFARILTKPIQSLNQATKLIADGDWNVEIQNDSKDEVGELAASFAVMADAVKKRQEQLELAVKQREDFIGNFTHELKTPMTSIMGYTKILQQDHYPKADKEKALRYIYSETKRLELLSRRLLDLMGLSGQPIDLQRITVTALFTDVQKLAKERLHIEQLIVVQEAADVIGDEQLLISCIMNLLENARKACDEHSEIVLSGKIVQNKYQIAVKDQGIGMEQKEIKRITESFYTVDKARSKKSGGYGLGLSLCTSILKLHHSELCFESEINKGTTVSFLLEVADDEAS